MASFSHRGAQRTLPVAPRPEFGSICRVTASLRPTKDGDATRLTDRKGKSRPTETGIATQDGLPSDLVSSVGVTRAHDSNRREHRAFGTKLFSARTGEAFLEYLADLERLAGGEHVRLVARIYGDDWSTPFRDLLIHERARQARPADR